MPLLKQIIYDLEYAFNREFKLKSDHILLVGELNYKALITDDVLDFPEDRHSRNEELYRFLRDIDMYRRIDLVKKLKDKLEICKSFLEQFFISTKGQQLGKTNCLYKARKQETVSRNKYHKKLGLKCVHSNCNIKLHYT